MKRLTTIIVALLTVFSRLCSYAQEHDYGLRIETFPSPASKFTGLILEGGKEIRLKGNEFKMDFYLFNRDDNAFGTIFRIITDKGYNIDLMYTVGLDGNHYPILVTGEYVHDIECEIVMGKWFPVSISINPKDGKISVDYNGTKISVTDAVAKGAKNLKISFGHSPIQGYVLDDVASISVRDIVLWQKGRLSRHWDLSIHDGDVCLDNVKGIPAKTINPSWIVDQYISWKDVCSFSFDKETCVAFKPEGKFYMTVDGKTINTFNVNTKKEGQIVSRGGYFPANGPNQLKFIDGKLIAYNLDENISSTFDFCSSRWEDCAKSTKDHDYWNNASCVWKNENAIVSFGGYGHFRYNNTLLIQYPSGHKMDTLVKLTDITPRYGSSVCIVEDSLYIFGGRGNYSGKQELSPRYYYDLYAVDLKSMNVKLLWTAENEDSHFTLGEEMMYEKSEDCFYAFASYDSGKLIKFDRKDASFEEMSLSANLVGNGQYNNYQIFQDKDKNKLYAVLSKTQVDKSSTVKIVEMNWPPVTMQLLHQSIEPEETKDIGTNKSLLWAIVITVAASCIFVGSRIERGRKNARKSSSLNIDETTQYYDFSRNSICFFGGFKVKDKNGNDITSQFTPSLKALLILLLLHSGDDSTGISSGKLNRILWPYKPEEAANNNRNVYISKLRAVLESMDGFTINNKNKLWNIILDDKAQCDWIIVNKLYKNKENEENTLRVIELLLKGVMLPNSEFDWLDSYKADFSNNTIDLLGHLLNREDIQDNLKIRVANTIFMHDFLNEEALRAKCKILYKEGKSGLAKSVYDNFCKEYRSSLGIDYETDFKSLVKEVLTVS